MFEGIEITVLTIITCCGIAAICYWVDDVFRRADLARRSVDLDDELRMLIEEEG